MKLSYLLPVALIAACSTDPNSPFYTGAPTSQPLSVAQEEVSSVETGTVLRCMTTEVLANETYEVIPKGAKGIIREIDGKVYFIIGKVRHDVTNVPYTHVSC